MLFLLPLKKINKQFLVHANILIHKTIFHDKTSSILKIYDMFFFGIKAASARKIVIVNLSDGVYKKVVLVVVRIFF